MRPIFFRILLKLNFLLIANQVWNQYQWNDKLALNKKRIGATNKKPPQRSGFIYKSARHYVAVAQRFNHLKILQSPLNLQFNGDFLLCQKPI